VKAGATNRVILSTQPVLIGAAVGLVLAVVGLGPGALYWRSWSAQRSAWRAVTPGLEHSRFSEGLFRKKSEPSLVGPDGTKYVEVPMERWGG